MVGMKSRSFAFALASLTLFAPLAACSADSATPSTNTDDGELIGGEEVSETAFRSTLLIRGNCTVSRVGPRHILTAAHCIFDEATHALRADFMPGAVLDITSANAADSYGPKAESGFRAVTIAKMHVPAVYFEERISGVRVLGEQVAPDVAVIELSPEAEKVLADVPIAKVDLAAVEPGDKVVIMGYGCEAGLNGPKDYSKQRLKLKRTVALGLDSQSHEGSWVGKDLAGERAKRLEKGYLFTPGQRGKTEEASLCPGDSGGPVYRDDGAENRIVGVNAYYSFRPDDGYDVSMTNWHTRLDLGSRFDIGSFLAEAGVSVIGGTKSDHHAACTKHPRTSRSLCGAFAATVARGGGDAVFGAPLMEPRYERDAAGAWVWTQKLERKVLEQRGADVKVLDVASVDGCSGKSDGLYCGVALGETDPKSLVRCGAGKVASRETCALACEGMPAGVPDRCRVEAVDPCKRATAGDGRYCGGSIGGDKTSVYACTKGATFSKIVCKKGCRAMPNGVPDRCAP